METNYTVGVKEIKEWVESNIDFWEDVIKKHPIGTLEDVVQKEFEGALKSLKYILEFIEGNKR